MARITWQNIDAPDFDDAIRARASGADMIRRAVQDIGGSVQGIGKNNQQAASQRAMAEAMGIRDISEWDRLMSSGGMASLGINPDEATPELLEFYRGYRGDLNQERTDDIGFQRDQVDLAGAGLLNEGRALDNESAAFGLDRSRTEAGRNDLRWNREEEELEISQEGMRIADELGNRNEILTPEEARLEIVNMGLEPRLEAAALSAIQEYNWMIDPTVGIDTRTSDLLTMAQDTITVRSNANNWERAGNPLAAVYVSAGSNYDTRQGSIARQLAERVGAEVDTENPEAFARQTGEVADLINTLKNDPELQGIPEAVIATVLESNLRGAWDGSLRDWNRNVDFAVGPAKDQLLQLAAEENRMSLSEDMIRYEREESENQALTTTLDRLTRELQQAVARNAPDRADEIRQEISKTIIDAGVAPEGGGGGGESPDDVARRLMNEALGIEVQENGGSPLPPPAVDEPGAGDGDIDPRISQDREMISGALQSVADFSQGLGVGRRTLAANIEEGAGQLGARAVGLFNPEAGTRLMNVAEEQRESREQDIQNFGSIRQFGEGFPLEMGTPVEQVIDTSFGPGPGQSPIRQAGSNLLPPVPGGTVPKSAGPTTTPAQQQERSRLIQDAVRDPQAGLELIAGETGMSAQQLNTAQTYLRLLETTSNPETKETARQQLRNILGDLENAGNVSREVQQLIQGLKMMVE